jgi:hypothetical protein
MTLGVWSAGSRIGGVPATNPSALHRSQATSLSLQPGLVGKGADMSDEFDWDFGGADDAKAEIRAAVGCLLNGVSGSAAVTWCRILSRLCAKSQTAYPLDSQIPWMIPGG